MSQRPRVSVSLILKDAMRTLPQLLTSLEWVTSGEPDTRSAVKQRLFCFDEIVFVDTGSHDDTYQELVRWADPRLLGALASACGDDARERALKTDSPSLPPGEGVVDLDVNISGTRFVFARYGWCDRFNAARNFSFELSKADIRGYLDADDYFSCDEAGSKARHLPRIMASALRKDPRTAEFNMIYDYDVGMEQKHSRFFVWNRGFTWEGWIHESCNVVGELDTQRGIGRGVYKIHDPGLVVHHDKTTQESTSSVLRNQRIALAAYAAASDPSSDIDLDEKARMAFHIAEFAKATIDSDPDKKLAEAERYFGETIDGLPGSNYHALALQGLTQIHLDLGNHPKAILYAGGLAGQFPELLNGTALLLMAHNTVGHWERTAALYREMKDRVLVGQRNHSEDTWLTRGWLFVAAAKALVKIGAIDEATEALLQVPREVSNHGLVREPYTEANILLMQAVGIRRLADFTEFLVWDCEASKALAAFDYATPMAIRRLPAVADMRAALVAKMHHLKDWPSYQAAYASIPAEDFDTKRVARAHFEQLVRVQTLVAWGKSLDAEGPEVRVLSVGFHAGIIEQMLLETNSRIRIDVADVAAAQTSQGWTELAEKFPGRVALHTMTKHHYDWGSVADLYDAAILFEVIEHVPDEQAAHDMLHMLLKVGGVLFESTPNSERWVETYLTEPPPVGPSWYGHVRAYDYLELRDQLWNAGFSVDMLLEGHDNVFTVQATKLEKGRIDSWMAPFGAAPQGIQTPPPQRIGIFLPSTPTPFDAVTPTEGPLGGSEEAVVHLAAEMARLGHIVEVFTPMPKRENVARIVDNVTYRPVNEFPASGFLGGEQHFDAVIFWRCPGIFDDVKVKAAPYKKILWLHDAYYNVPSYLYEVPDAVLTLSEHHRTSVIARDSAPPTTSWRPFANGIDPEQFPLWDPELRDPHKVIYASSPDRGLETLLEVWPAVRNAVDDATLDIYYDWGMVKRHKPALYASLMARIDELRPLGVRYHGGVAQPVLHDLMRRAGVWAYPNIGEVETFCITAVKALAAGMEPVATAAGALPEVLDRECLALQPDGLVDTEDFCDALIEALDNPAEEGARRAGRESALKRYSWPVTAKRLETILMDLKRAKR